jgi:RNA polymerase sigma-70 factor (ECF subfamily)
MRDVTVSDIERLSSHAEQRDVVLAMDEDTFRAFYEHTSRPLWAYLARLSGSRTDADDLLQETYYRFVRARMAFESEPHRRRYLYTIATNLVLDRRRRSLTRPEVPLPGHADDLAGVASEAGRLEHQVVVRGALARLKPRERALLWLAYAQGATHEEIGAALGLKPASIRSMIFRARQRFSDVLRGTGKRGGRRATE